MKIKTKLILGVGLLFVLVVLLSSLGMRQIWKLSEETKSILKANYNTLDYVRNMLSSLDKINTDTLAVAIFYDNLRNQQKNITEPGEKEATHKLAAHFEEMRKLPKDAELPVKIREDLNEIMRLNMDAIQNKSKTAEKTADQAIIWLGITGALCFLIAFMLAINMPGSIADPIHELTESIRQIASRNYDQRVHFKSGSEFGQLAEAFNTMAAKLEEYENSILSKALFEKKRTEAVIEQMQEPIIGLDEQRRVLFANRKSLALLNLKKEEIVGKQAEEVSKYNDLFRALASNLSKPPSNKSEPLKIYSDGRESYFEKEIIPVDLAPTGEKEARHIGDVILLKNITELKTLDLAKINLLRTVAKEVRGPVADILSTLNELSKQAAPSQTDHLDRLKEDGQRLLKITGTLQNLSQVESGNINMSFSEINIEEMINYALDTVKNQAAQKKVSITTKLAENLPHLLADADKTTWILVNFLVNAIRYSPEKGIVTVEVKPENGQVCFSVKDEGQGIEEKYRDKVFERYFRVPGSEKQGIGLALAIGKEFIEAQGGSIGVESELGAGSRFWFMLNTAG